MSKQNAVRVSAEGIQIKLADFEAPKLTVFAHECSLLRYGYLMEFAFLQNRPGEPQRLGVSIVIPVFDVAAHIWAATEEFYKTVKAAYAKRGVEMQEPGTSAPAYGNAPVLGANILRVARAGMNCAMDWYYLSPHEHHMAKSAGKRPQIEPVVRVQLTGPTLLGVLNQIAIGHSEWRKQAGSE